MSNKLDWRELTVLSVFETRSLVRLCDVPTYVGLGTMDRLVAKGIIEPANPSLPLYYSAYSWKLTSAMEGD